MIYFLNEVELVVCNAMKLVVEPEWTMVRPSLEQKSIIITDEDSRKASGEVHVCRYFGYWMLKPLFTLDGTWYSMYVS